MSTKIAFVGNPNSGKTTLFNLLTNSREYVGNRIGVTVDKKEKNLRNAADIIAADLPGIYSLSIYSPEEDYTLRYLQSENPDIILNVANASDLSRSLYLTTQLAELKIPMITVLNMIDEAEKKGIDINTDLLSEKLGFAVLPISAKNGQGTSELLAEIQALSKRKESAPASQIIPENEEMISKRYHYIDKLIKRCSKQPKNSISATIKADRILASGFHSLILFSVIISVVYFASITLTARLCGLFGSITETAENLTADFLHSIGCAEWLISLISDGAIKGVGSVLNFVPQLFVLFFLLAFLEECGYMARIAYMLDRIFRKFGMSGKSVIPMIIASGCGAVGITSSRTIENEGCRRLSVITATFIPCSAKLPIISLISTQLLGGAWWAAPSAYLIGIVATLLSGIILKNFKDFSDENTQFILELPPYRIPELSSLIKSASERVLGFIRKAGTIILLSSLAIRLFAMMNITGTTLTINPKISLSESILGSLGKALSPIFAPLGFGEAAPVTAVLMGIVAKEEIAAVLGITGFSGFTFLSGLSFMVFNLLCVPCISAIAAISREMNSAKWTIFTVLYQCVFAYAISLAIYQIGRIIGL